MNIRYLSFPVEIDIRLPDGICHIELSDDLNVCYNQLILYIIIHSYWYYVLSVTAVPDEEFDWIKSSIASMEQDDMFGELKCQYKNAANPNGYSPSENGVNGGNRCNHHSSRYPLFVQRIFEDAKQGIETWRIRPWYLDLTIHGKEPTRRKKQFPVESEEDKIRRERGTLLEFADANVK